MCRCISTKGVGKKKKCPTAGWNKKSRKSHKDGNFLEVGQQLKVGMANVVLECARDNCHWCAWRTSSCQERRRYRAAQGSSAKMLKLRRRAQWLAWPFPDPPQVPPDATQAAKVPLPPPCSVYQPSE